MTKKEKHVLEGQMVAACVIVGEICQELRTLDLPEEMRILAAQAALANSKLLRALGYAEEASGDVPGC